MSHISNVLDFKSLKNKGGFLCSQQYLGLSLKNLPTNYEDNKCLLQYSDSFLSLFFFAMSASYWTILWHINKILKFSLGCVMKKALSINFNKLTNLCGVCVCVCVGALWTRRGQWFGMFIISLQN